MAQPVSRLNYDEITILHFTLGQKTETALLSKSATSEEIKELFRNAGEAGSCDIVKLYTANGHLLNISPRIPPNDATAPYRLVVVGVHCDGLLMEEIGMDLLSLDKRVQALEGRLKGQASPSDAIIELKETLGALRNKLEELEHLSWLGFYKGLHPLPLPKENTRQTAIYRSGSGDLKDMVCNKFLKVSNVILSEETVCLLMESTFDNWQWEDEELLLLIQTMYNKLGLITKFHIEIHVLRNFLMRVYRHYNDVPFHNFRHSFCVTQMMFGIVSKVKLGERVGDLEILILLTSCVCHDLDHPGYNNIYQINAQTELALRYNDISPLENHHCSTAFRILSDPASNIFQNLPVETWRTVREGMIRCILATDMARHNEILHQFREIIQSFEPSNKTHVNLLSMVLIKVADISNEARPMNVAEPWLDCLLTEFFQQSDTEKLEGLPVTPFMDRDKITKPSSQCSFIGLVLLPLFEALASLFTELEPVIIAPVRYALDYYRRLNEASLMLKRRSTDAQTHRGSTVSSSQPNSLCDHLPSDGGYGRRTRDNSFSTSTEVSRPSSTLPHPHRGSSVSLPPPRPSIPHLSSFPSVDSSHSDRDSDPEEAMTEVSVSEKALKFKIATESSMELTTAVSRKGSRENDTSDNSGVHVQFALDESIEKVDLKSEEVQLKPKGKESFFRRFKSHFTEKLGIPRTENKDFGSTSGTTSAACLVTSSDLSLPSNSTTQSPKLGSSSHGFSYFRRAQGNDKGQIASSSPRLPTTNLSSPSPRRRSSSCRRGSEAVAAGGGLLESSSGGGNNVSGKPDVCIGSLESVTSKEEGGNSPVKRLILPRFSSFVLKRTSRMGILIKRSPKRVNSPENVEH